MARIAPVGTSTPPGRMDCSQGFQFSDRKPSRAWVVMMKGMTSTFLKYLESSSSMGWEFWEPAWASLVWVVGQSVLVRYCASPVLISSSRVGSLSSYWIARAILPSLGRCFMPVIEALKAVSCW